MARVSLVVCVVVCIAHRLAAGCEVHAVYSATQLMQGSPGPFVSIGEQFSAGRTVRDGDRTVDSDGEWLNTSITQLTAGWNIAPQFGVLATLPIIAREYRRRENDTLVRGHETGPGDVSLLARWTPFNHIDERWSMRFSVLGGLKLPSGDAARLADERTAQPTAEVRQGPLHGGGGDEDEHESAVHSHDLALGSGSVDGLVGGQLYFSWRRAFVSSTLQYAVRTEGDFDYHFANALAWVGQTGWFVVARPDLSVGLAAAFSGETKGKDHQDGAQLNDTGLTTVYGGPSMLVTWGTHLGGELTVDLPIVQHTTAAQIVPDVRVRGGFTWRF